MLEIQNLSLSLGGKPILCDLSLHVEKREIHGVLGKNGTGKSTLAYLIMGVNNYIPTAGRFIFENEDITGLSVSQRAQKGISLAWQEPARIEGLSVRDYLTLSGKARGANHIEDYLRVVGLEPAQYLDRDIDNTLSGGERKRIEMASILAMRPKLAILDEPDSGIDILALPSLLNAIVEMNKQGSSVLLITHNEKVAEIAHRVSVMCAGRILKTGEPGQMNLWFKDNCQPCVHVNEPEKESDRL
jgi:Fe-S cluster assembly ATP-binding protein